MFTGRFDMIHMEQRESGSGKEERRLLSERLAAYNSNERPVTMESSAVVLKINLTLQQIVDLDEKNQVLTTNMWINLDWEDHSMTWNPREYNNLTDIRIPPSMLWMPDIMLYNSANPSFYSTYPSNVIVNHDGAMSQIPPGIFKSTCLVDITWFPFDEQKCLLKFGTWSHKKDKIDLQLHGNKDEGHGDLSTFKENGEWLLVDFTAKREVTSWEQDEYTEVYFYLVLQRRTIYYFNNLIFPCVLIASMAVFGFTTPAECGEKLTLEITILMSLTFYLQMVSDMQPPTSLNPILGVYFSCVMMTVASSVVVTIMILNYQHRDPSTHEMSRFIRLVFLKWLPWLLRMDRPGKPNLPLKEMTLKSKMKRLEKADEYPMSLLPDILDTKEDFVAGALANVNTPLREEVQIHKDREERNVEEPVSPNRKVGVIERDLILIRKELMKLSTKKTEDMESDEVVSEWRFAAMVMDRLCLVILTSTTLLLSLCVFFTVPRVFVF